MSKVDWFVVRTQPQAEQRVQRGLRENGLEAYLPTETRWRRTRYRTARVFAPMFPSYLFVGLSTGRPEFYIVRALDGFLGFLGIDGKPFPVRFGKVEAEPDQFSIEAMREAETLGLFDFTRSKKISFEPGQPVRIIGGHFAGFMAKVLETPGGDAKRIRILMDALGPFRSAPHMLDIDQIEAA